MIRFIIVAILAVISISGCRPAPPADLELIDVTYHPHHYDVHFDSDINFSTLYSKSFFQSPASKALICSIEDDPDFDVDFGTGNPGRGDLEFVATRLVGAKQIHTFKSHLDFWKILSGPGRPKKVFSNDEIKQLFEIHEAIECKVQITVFVGPNYYSKILRIPRESILAVTEKIPRVSE